MKNNIVYITIQQRTEKFQYPYQLNCNLEWDKTQDSIVCNDSIYSNIGMFPIKYTY